MCGCVWAAWVSAVLFSRGADQALSHSSRLSNISLKIIKQLFVSRSLGLPVNFFPTQDTSFQWFNGCFTPHRLWGSFQLCIYINKSWLDTPFCSKQRLFLSFLLHCSFSHSCIVQLNLWDYCLCISALNWVADSLRANAAQGPNILHLQGGKIARNTLFCIKYSRQNSASGVSHVLVIKIPYCLF